MSGYVVLIQTTFTERELEQFHTRQWLDATAEVHTQNCASTLK